MMHAGRPRVPLRTMRALLYLQNAFNLSDEAVAARWAENPYWQYFSGLAYFEPRPPRDRSLLFKFRKLIGEEGVEELLAQTVLLAVQLKLIRKQDLQTVVINTTVQSKAVVDHPTDSRLLEVASSKLVGKRSIAFQRPDHGIASSLESAEKEFFRADAAMPVQELSRSIQF